MQRRKYKRPTWIVLFILLGGVILGGQLCLYRPRPIVRHPEDFVLLEAALGMPGEGKDVASSLGSRALAGLPHEAPCVQSGAKRSGFPSKQAALYIRCMDGGDVLEIVLGPGINKRFDSGVDYPYNIREPERLQADILALLQE